MGAFNFNKKNLTKTTKWSYKINKDHNVAHPYRIRYAHHQIAAVLDTAELSQLRPMVYYIDK